MTFKNPILARPANRVVVWSIVALQVVLGVGPASAAEEIGSPQILITKARVFDGVNEELSDGMSVLVEGRLITTIADSIPTPEGATVIDAEGRILIPGLIDAHWHTYYAYAPQSVVYNEAEKRLHVQKALMALTIG